MSSESSEDWHSTQKRYYDERSHGYLAPAQGGPYAEHLVDRIWRILGADGNAHGLEIGCGAGRFTVPLLSRCRSLEVADFSGSNPQGLNLFNF